MGIKGRETRIRMMRWRNSTWRRGALMEMDEKRKREVRDVKINNWRAVRRWNDPFIPLGLSPSISRLLILPILQLSLTSSTPTGLSICLITKWNASLKKKKKSSLLWCTFRFITGNRPVRCEIICIHKTNSALTSTYRVTLTRRSWPNAGSRRARRRFVTPVEAWSLMSQLKCYRIDVDTKVAGSETDMTAGIWQEDAGGPP